MADTYFTSAVPLTSLAWVEDTSDTENMVKNLLNLHWWDEYLGHGRFMECCLVLVKVMYGSMFLASAISGVEPTIVAFAAIDGSPALLAIPFFLASGLSFMGLLLNGMGYECSKWFRIFGATVGMSIWLFVIGNNLRLGHPFAGVMPWMLMAIVASLWIIRRGIKGLPRPGALGQF